jgi:hypothetical protein
LHGFAPGRERKAGSRRIGAISVRQYNESASRERRMVRGFRGADQGRYAMELQLTGPEIHALRELIEEAINKLGKEIPGVTDPKTQSALKENKGIYKVILDKLPVEFGTVS